MEYPNDFREDCERHIWVDKGVLRYETLLLKTYIFGPGKFRLLLDIVEDHVYESDEGERINWTGVWKEWDRQIPVEQSRGV